MVLSTTWGSGRGHLWGHVSIQHLGIGMWTCLGHGSIQHMETGMWTSLGTWFHPPLEHWDMDIFGYMVLSTTWGSEGGHLWGHCSGDRDVDVFGTWFHRPCGDWDMDIFGDMVPSTRHGSGRGRLRLQHGRGWERTSREDPETSSAP